MAKYYLAVDIGASSGRHILGHLENGKIELEEIYRFENGMDHKDGKLLWNVDRLFGEILNGMKKCKEQGKIPVSMAIDTWAVDYVLLDEKDRILGDNGHLSNDDCGEALASYATPELHHVWLCHLSEENNHPELARKTVEQILRSKGIIAGKDFQLEVLKRKTPSEIFNLV